VYFDDLLMLSPTASAQESTLASLHDLYDIRRMEHDNMFLGVCMRWDADGRCPHMFHSNYTLDMLKRFAMENSKPAVTPMVEAFFTGLKPETDKTVVDPSCTAAWYYHCCAWRSDRGRT
jgi:hypothetical protein